MALERNTAFKSSVGSWLPAVALLVFAGRVLDTAAQRRCLWCCQADRRRTGSLASGVNRPRAHVCHRRARGLRDRDRRDAHGVRPAARPEANEKLPAALNTALHFNTDLDTARDRLLAALPGAVTQPPAWQRNVLVPRTPSSHGKQRR